MATAKWLGTASLELEHDGKVLLIDPHLSRPDKWRTFTRPLAPDADKIGAYLAGLEGEVLGIIVTHSHSDHLVDTPYIARRLGIPVWGNESTDTLLRLSGLPGCARVLAGGETFEIGPFTVEAIRTRHGNVAFGKVPFPGRIPSNVQPPLRVWHYRHGEPPLLLYITAGGRTIFHQGTANLIDNLLPVRQVGSAWVCVSGHGYTPDFVPRLLRRVRPEKMIPFHFEDFSRPLAADTPFLPGADPHAFGRKVQAVAPEVKIVVPQPYERIPF